MILFNHLICQGALHKEPCRFSFFIEIHMLKALIGKEVRAFNITIEILE